MFCGREGNRRSGVALATRHRLKWFIQLRAQGLSKGDGTPSIGYLSGVWYFTFTFRGVDDEYMPDARPYRWH